MKPGKKQVLIPSKKCLPCEIGQQFSGVLRNDQRDNDGDELNDLMLRVHVQELISDEDDIFGCVES